MNDTERLNFIQSQLLDEATGLELFPVGADVTYESDGNTILSIDRWQWLGYYGKTFRDAIDAAMEAEKKK